jgi:tetratricopeptide (TPR) repeat protein
MRKGTIAWLLTLAVTGCVGEEAKHKAAGNILFHNGDLPGAEKEYRAALAAAPNDANSHTLLGNALFEEGKLDDAQKSYADALARDGKAREARRGLATVALRKNDPKSAREQLETLIKEMPTDGEAQAALGKLLLSQNDLDGAEEHLQYALKSVLNDPGSLYCLGIVLARKKQRAQALDMFDRLEVVTPGQPYAPYGRAAVAAQSGETDEALGWMKKALDRGIGDLDGVLTDPALAPIAAEPRLAQLVAEARTRAGPKKGAPER